MGHFTPAHCTGGNILYTHNTDCRAKHRKVQVEIYHITQWRAKQLAKLIKISINGVTGV